MIRGEGRGREEERHSGGRKGSIERVIWSTRQRGKRKERERRKKRKRKERKKKLGKKRKEKKEGRKRKINERKEEKKMRKK